MRNVRCPQYGRCLDRAIDRNRADFDCATCPHRHEQDEITALEVARCLVLIAAILAGVKINPEAIDLGELLSTTRPWREFVPTPTIDRA